MSVTSYSVEIGESFKEQPKSADSKESNVYTVYNEVEISGVPATIRGFSPAKTEYPEKVKITTPDNDETPKAITPDVAIRLWHHYGISAEKRGIEIIDPSDDAVYVLTASNHSDDSSPQ